jgi:oxygen-dependent protoporphyrinogen oxidase
MSLRGGLGQFVARLQAELPRGVAVPDAEVECIERSGGFDLRFSNGSSVSARAVIAATPAFATSTLTRPLDAELSALCGTIRYAPSVTVALGYRRDDVRHPLQGWGFMVPAAEKRRIRSASWVSSKWPDRAPAGHALIRVSLAAAPSTLEAPDRTLAEWAHDDLAALLGISGAPALARVYRRPMAMPQLEVGHLDRMSAIERRLASLPGLFITASGFRGIGMPDCIADAHRTAHHALDYVTRCS